LNFSAHLAASDTPPMHVSAMTTSTAWPEAWRTFSASSRATFCAIPIVWPSNDSRTPPNRPSMVGRMPILGIAPRRRLTGGLMFMTALGSENPDA
jgi:hypothetical protein